MTSQEERLRILDMLSEGKISPDEATQLLAVIGTDDDFDEEDWEDEEDFEDADPFSKSETSSGQGSDPGGVSPAPTEGSPPPPPDLAKWRRWWFLPLGVGVVITTFSGLLLYWGTQAEWAGFWLACTWLPLLAGIAVIALAWMSRTSRWLHIRVHTGEEWPKRIAISLPLPIRMTAWGLRTFGNRIPGLENTGIDEIIMALGESATPDAPLYIEVDEGPGQEKVQVYIG